MPLNEQAKLLFNYQFQSTVFQMKKETKALPQYNNSTPKTCVQKVFNLRPPYTQLKDRSIISNLPDESLGDNSIETSKYNLITFFPLNLIVQVTKPSNIYFLVIMILQIIPAISVSDGKPTMVFPLSIVILMSMIKDFVEDWKRRKNDQRENQAEIEILREQGWNNATWKQIKVGNLIKIKRDQYFPCDILLLKHDQDHKEAHIETKNLDGESNLKIKLVPKSIRDIVATYPSENTLFQMRMKVNYERPNPFLTTFNGNIQTQEANHVLDNNNVVLRGCSLKINQFVIGLCIYNGHECKIMLNGGKSTQKISKLEQALNYYLRFVIVFLIVSTLASALTYGLLLMKHPQIRTYIQENKSNVVAAILAWGSWFISFSNFIPISLLVSVDMVRWGQGYIVEKDEQCKSGDKSVEVQTSSVNSQLGQVQYVLSDKTGTITKNIMSFKCLYVDGVSYGDIEKDNEVHSFHSKKESLITINNQPEDQHIGSDQTIKKDELVHFSPQAKESLIKQIKRNNLHSRHINEALLHLSICHSVVLQEDKYSSASSDELALVEFAKYIGYEFKGKNMDEQMLIQLKTSLYNEDFIKVKLLHVLEFSSERKRMSVIIEKQERDGKKIFLMSKGADDVMLKRLARKSGSQYALDELNFREINDYLRRYSSRGLRTLILASRELKPSYFQKWDSHYTHALTSLSPDRMQLINELKSQIQQELDFVGITAIQDQLQLDVKYTIEALQRSNIKVWMLTGDKMETAESIGFSCGLIDERTVRIYLVFGQDQMQKYLENKLKFMENLKEKIVVILTGEFFDNITEGVKPILEKILKKARNVIFCRVSPKNKQEVTVMVKEWGVTLAVGDGANDVNMINAAHVGVGVRGIEGSQATRAADYVIGQFRILNRLILFHGLNLYHRNSNLILYILFKNTLVAMPVLVYGSISMQSAYFLYDNWTFQLYNILFVFFPIMYFGLVDVIYSQKMIIQKPHLYKQGQNGKYFNNWILARMFICVIIYSCMLVFLLFQSSKNLSSSGKVPYQDWVGMEILGIVVIACNIRIYFISHQINILQNILILIGVISFYLCYFLISIVLKTTHVNVLRHQITTPTYWFMAIYFVTVINLVEIFIQGYIRIVQTIEQKKEESKTFLDKKLKLRSYEANNIQYQVEKMQKVKIERRNNIDQLNENRN